jgi:hypothetical protein
MLMATNYFVTPINANGRVSASRGEAWGMRGVSKIFPLLRDSDSGLRYLTKTNYTGATLTLTARREYDQDPIITKSSANNQIIGGNGFIDIHFLMADTANLTNNEALITIISSNGIAVYEFKLAIYV